MEEFSPPTPMPQRADSKMDPKRKDPGLLEVWILWSLERRQKRSYYLSGQDVWGSQTSTAIAGGVMDWIPLIWLAHGLIDLFIADKDVMRLK